MGGSGVIHFLSGPTPAAVSKQLTQEITGRVQLPPFWSLGFHLCRESDNNATFWNTLNEMVAFFSNLKKIDNIFTYRV